MSKDTILWSVEKPRNYGVFEAPAGAGEALSCGFEISS
ncbi:hypothetical protein ARTHRO9AX_70048 [Arthrobacter sp. 9AX]|nr:hypothetical protein ARTHRO9AX_70048 [Arthrobacter sp. 9AX]